MSEPVHRIDQGEVSLLWGNAAEAKAELREESLRRFQALPIGERLRLALSMLVKAPDGQPGDR